MSSNFLIAPAAALFVVEDLVDLFGGARAAELVFKLLVPPAFDYLRAHFFDLAARFVAGHRKRPAAEAIGSLDLPLPVFFDQVNALFDRSEFTGDDCRAAIDFFLDDRRQTDAAHGLLAEVDRRLAQFAITGGRGKRHNGVNVPIQNRLVILVDGFRRALAAATGSQRKGKRGQNGVTKETQHLESP
jgi:hypothetical protein